MQHLIIFNGLRISQNAKQMTDFYGPNNKQTSKTAIPRLHMKESEHLSNAILYPSLKICL